MQVVETNEWGRRQRGAAYVLCNGIAQPSGRPAVSKEKHKYYVLQQRGERSVMARSRFRRIHLIYARAIDRSIDAGSSIVASKHADRLIQKERERIIKAVFIWHQRKQQKQSGSRSRSGSSYSILAVVLFFLNFYRKVTVVTTTQPLLKLHSIERECTVMGHLLHFSKCILNTI